MNRNIGLCWPAALLVAMGVITVGCNGSNSSDVATAIDASGDDAQDAGALDASGSQNGDAGNPPDAGPEDDGSSASEQCGIKALVDGKVTVTCGGGFEDCLNFFFGFTNCLCNDLLDRNIGYDTCAERLQGGFTAETCGTDGRSQSQLIEQMSSYIQSSFYNNVSLEPMGNCAQVPTPAQ